MNLFDELNHTTAAYCSALGLDAKSYESRLSDAEINGAPLSFEERMRADQLRLRRIVVRQQREIRLRNIGYAPGNFAKLVKREQRVRSEA